ncbi:hypothetical protein P692DRAFT_20689096, partial [Suillus brevipes Sb2]
MRTCSVAGEYLRAGRIIRDGQYFAFPDRSRLRRFGNETFKQAIDSRYSTTPNATPATGANSIPINTTRVEPTPPVPTEIPSSALISDSYFIQCEPIAGNHAVIVTVEEEENEKANVLAITRSKSRAAPAVDSTSTPKPTPPPPSLEHVSPDPAKANDIDIKKGPAYKYESKATSPDAARRIYETILSTPIPQLTISDLLSISPDLRKEAVEHSRTHRVPTPIPTSSTNILA